MTMALPRHVVRPNRCEELFETQRKDIYIRTDRLFIWLMPIQWLAAIVFALWVSPLAWAGATSSIHPHVWAAVFLGGVISFWPVLCAVRIPGEAITRQTIAAGQMLMSALLIHLSGGRIETHFHVFGSLALLAFYRNPKVLITATAIVAADHFVRGVYFPLSAFGTLTTSPYRWLEHSAWVIFEDVFLFIGIHQSLGEMRNLAERQASLEAVNADIERQVIERTAELTGEIQERKRAEENRAELAAQLAREHQRFEDILNNIPVVVFEDCGRAGSSGHYVSGYVEKMVGYTKEEWGATENFWINRVHPDDREEVQKNAAQVYTGDTGYHYLCRWLAKDGRVAWGETHVVALRDEYGEQLGVRGITIDVTERISAEAALDRLNKQLVNTSRQAGMAEIATSVLHNIGNVLNSVNVSCSMISDRVRKSRIDSVAKTAELLQQHAGDLAEFFTSDSAGSKLPGYLGKLAVRLADERTAMLDELDVLGRHIDHIKDIVTVQQSYAKNLCGVRETMPLEGLLEDALRMNQGGLARHRITIVRQFGEAPAVPMEKHKVLQILVNLIRNAKHALTDGGYDHKTLILGVAKGEDHVAVTVRDDGIGIAPENLTRIFAHGFTTKKDGHGFGLHSGVLAAREMGGSLTVESGGLGTGATFTLKLPLTQNDSQPEQPIP